jgi:hypothetical protein
MSESPGTLDDNGSEEGQNGYLEKSCRFKAQAA